MPQWGLRSKIFENTFSFTNMNSERRLFTLLATLLGGSSATTREFPPCGSTCLQVPYFIRSGGFLHLCFPSLIVCSVQLESFRKQISRHGHNSQLLMTRKITTLCHTDVLHDFWLIQSEATYITQYKDLNVSLTIEGEIVQRPLLVNMRSIASILVASYATI